MSTRHLPDVTIYTQITPENHVGEPSITINIKHSDSAGLYETIVNALLNSGLFNDVIDGSR